MTGVGTGGTIGTMVSESTESAVKTVHDFRTRIPQPAFEAAQQIAALTGTSVNNLLVQGLDMVIETFNATASSTTASATAATFDAVQAYTSSGSGSVARHSATPLVSWTASDAYKTAINALAGKTPEKETS